MTSNAGHFFVYRKLTKKIISLLESYLFFYQTSSKLFYQHNKISFLLQCILSFLFSWCRL